MEWTQAHTQTHTQKDIQLYFKPQHHLLAASRKINTQPQLICFLRVRDKDPVVIMKAGGGYFPMEIRLGMM